MIAHPTAYSHPRHTLRRLRLLRWEAVGLWALLLAAAALLLISSLDLDAARGGLATFAVALLALVLGLFLLRFVSFHDWAVGKARSGWRAERRALRALRRLPDSYDVFPNYRPPGWHSDIDLLVVGPDSICLVEVKSDPGRIATLDGHLVSRRAAGTISLDPELQRTHRRAKRLRQHLIAWARQGSIPSGVPRIPALTAFQCRPGSHIDAPDACLLDHLPAAVARQHPVLPTHLRQALVQALAAAQGTP